MFYPLFNKNIVSLQMDRHNAYPYCKIRSIMEKEIWKDVVGFEGLYQISSLGRVKSLNRVTIDSRGRIRPVNGRMLKIRVSKNTGYPQVHLSKDGKSYDITIHRLIAEAFIPNPKNLPCINHIDQDRGNSVLSNLEWCTYSYNNSYGDAIPKRKKTLRQSLIGKHKIIYQFSKKGDLIRCYVHGVQQFEEELGYEIQSCLTGSSKTCNGFIFSYNNVFHYEEDKPKRHQKYVYLLDKEGCIKEKYKSVSEAGRKNGFDRHLFSKNRFENGIVSIYGKDFFVEKKNNEYIPKGHKGTRPDLKGKGVKAISQYTKDAVFIRDFSSIIEAAEFMGSKNYGPEITNCCKGKTKTARGYIWTYKGAKKPSPFKNGTLRKIEQYALDGTYIATFDSIVEAAKSIGNGKPGSIANNLKGISKSAFGYLWKYKKE